MRAPDTRTPVTLLTGFLGSGKTTVLKRLLCEPDMAGTAVLINEFGEIGLDHLLVRSVHGNAVVLQNGCVCCSLQEDLRQGLRDTIDACAAGSFAPFDRIVIETTGLADPAPIIQTLLLDPMLRHQLRLAQTVTTVDAVNGAAQLRTHRESLRQAAVADRLVVTKSDLVTPAVLAALRQALASLNPTAWLDDAQESAFEIRAILTGGLADPATKLAEVRRWLDSAPMRDRDAGGHHAQGHDAHPAAHRHGSAIASFSLRVTEPLDWTAFGIWLTLLLHRHGPKVLRVKGLLNVSDALGPVVLHGVQHIIHPPVHLADWPDQDTSSRIAFIVEDIDPRLLEESLLGFLAAARGKAPVAA